jgi:predicted nicotinamide N-methyase
VDARELIRAHLPITPVEGLEGVRLHLAAPSSRLTRLVGEEGEPPYWAYVWAGGMALARHLQAEPATVRGRRVLDLGAGSGLVAIAAARAGASGVEAAETDPNGLAALRLNAALNGVEVSAIANDLLDGPAPETGLVLVGDLFYAPELARRVGGFLDRCRAAGVEALVGDIGRADLPRHRLELIMQYAVPDFGDGARAPLQPGGVYRWV